MEDIAGRGVRFAAFVVDGVALGAFWGVIHAIGIVELGSGDAPVDVLQAVLSVVYFVVLTAGFGQTIGKMALGIKGRRRGRRHAPDGRRAHEGDRWQGRLGHGHHGSGSSSFSLTASAKAGTTRLPGRSW